MALRQVDESSVCPLRPLVDLFDIPVRLCLLGSDSAKLELRIVNFIISLLRAKSLYAVTKTPLDGEQENILVNFIVDGHSRHEPLMPSDTDKKVVSRKLSETGPNH